LLRWAMSHGTSRWRAVAARANPNNFVNHVKELDDIHAPTLILWGRDDHYLIHSDADACRFHHAIKDSQLVVLPGLGHEGMKQCPETTASLARDFLLDKKVTPPAGSRTDCFRMRPSPRLAFPAKHCEADMSPQDVANRRAAGSFHFEGKEVFVVGRSGPPLILLHELPGLTKYTFQLADDLAAKNYVVYLPSLTGDPGIRHTSRNFLRTAMGPAFRGLFRSQTSPMAKWVVRLAQHIHAGDKENRPMGVIGMCMTGSYPIAALRLDFVQAAVLAQPALPYLWRTDLGVSDDDVTVAKRRGIPIFALRFSNDGVSPWERQEAYENEFKSQITFPTLDSSAGNPGCYDAKAHATLTSERIEAKVRGADTDQIFAEMTDYLDRQLRPNR
ncbi:MAG TPA: dienelactone hydrolase family protein, partial [Thermoanaerobaculia bacterium]|nr:dienelactone hydrolase family protein [Thermoanaerobaculia bacterium]